jgi:hypothetical protein
MRERKYIYLYISIYNRKLHNRKVGIKACTYLVSLLTRAGSICRSLERRSIAVGDIFLLIKYSRKRFGREGEILISRLLLSGSGWGVGK